jgi:hypothetical protein
VFSDLTGGPNPEYFQNNFAHSVVIENDGAYFRPHSLPDGRHAGPTTVT